MNRKFIKSIYKKNNTTEGRVKLYNTLAIEEDKIWQEILSDNITNWTEIFTQKAKKHGDKIAIVEVDSNKSYSYKELYIASEKIKNFVLNNISDHKIGLNYHNSFYFLATLIGINRAGYLAILFNIREPKNRLSNLAKEAKVKVLFGEHIDGILSLDIGTIIDKKETQISKKVPKKRTLDDPAFVIFTSGTSGASKPALFSHRRMVGAGVAWSLRTAMDSNDNCYITLPLYHGNGLAVALSAVLFVGAKATIRSKFSVSSFWKDINKYKCSHAVYIGELLRYLINKQEDIKNKYLKVIFGNGLNKLLWKDVIKRYNIEHVVEHFGATEMPSGALTNWFNKAGFCGYLPLNDPKMQEMVLVDDEFKTVKVNESGEALFLVTSGKYRGYLNPLLDEPKIYRNLFKNGDIWWRSGDLLKVNQDGFYSFIERLGDTYRFKGENVACVDVEEAIRAFGMFKEVAVYGIELPNIDGKIGMASIVIEDKFTEEDCNRLYKFLKARVAPYAMPYILKIKKDIHKTTSTLKIQKKLLSIEGISNYSNQPHFILIKDSYYRLNNEIYKNIINSKITLGESR